MAEPTVAYVGLGSNLGVRRRWIRRALRCLGKRPAMRLLAVSSLWETLPQGPPQPNYFNAVVAMTTELDPLRTLEGLLAVEAELGRIRPDRWAPRRIDLDLLFWDDAVVDLPGCTVPHPRLHTRAFVLAPLSELAPALVHPCIGRSVAELLQEVGNNGLLFRQPVRGYLLPRD